MKLGSVAAHNGELDAAVEYGTSALGDPRKCLPSLLAVATDLDTALRPHRHEPSVSQWREALGNVRTSPAIES